MEKKSKQPEKMKKASGENKMREIKMEKVVLNVGGTGDTLEKGVKLLKLLTNRKPMKSKAVKRIPSLGVRPGLEVGAVVTIRKGHDDVLKKMLAAVDNKIRKKQIANNNFSFGIKEYLEIPGMEYQREIGIIGLDVTVVFKRAGRRVRLKKVKRGRIPERQVIKPEEIIEFMKNKYKTNFV